MTAFDPQHNVFPFSLKQQLSGSTGLHRRQILRQLLNPDITIAVDHIAAAIIIQQQARVMVKPRDHRTLPCSLLNILCPVNIELVHVIG
ncbi:hypothetical protein D3C75_1112770 [compost metagenome]